jgi:hypothetical protein
MGGRRCSTSREERLSLSVEKSRKESRREHADAGTEEAGAHRSSAIVIDIDA